MAANRANPQAILHVHATFPDTILRLLLERSMDDRVEVKNRGGYIYSFSRLYCGRLWKDQSSSIDSHGNQASWGILGLGIL